MSVETVAIFGREARRRTGRPRDDVSRSREYDRQPRYKVEAPGLGRFCAGLGGRWEGGRLVFDIGGPRRASLDHFRKGPCQSLVSATSPGSLAGGFAGRLASPRPISKPLASCHGGRWKKSLLRRRLCDHRTSRRARRNGPSESCHPARQSWLQRSGRKTEQRAG